MTSIQYDESFLEQIRRDLADSLSAANNWEARASHNRAAARADAAAGAKFRRDAAQYRSLLDFAEGKPRTEPEPDPAEERAALAAGLRELADVLEGNPDVPVSGYQQIVFYVHGSNAQDKIAEVDRIAELLGVETDDFGPHHRAERMCGPVAYRAIATDVHNQKPAEAEAAPADGEAGA